MSDTPATETPAADAPKGDEGKGTDAPANTPAAEGKAPKWEGEFDAARAARLVENLRAENAALKAAAAKEQNSTKTSEERLAALEKALADSKRDLLVAQTVKKHGIPDDLVEFLTADTVEALEVQAERLAKHAKKPAEEVPGKPKPALKPGAGSETSEPDFDPAKVAAAVRRR